MKPCVTVSLVPEAHSGPFVFRDDLAAACAKAAQLGFTAIELFPPAFTPALAAEVAALLKKHRLKLAAVGTGGGWLKHQLTLTSSRSEVRARAIEFIRVAIDFAAPFKAAVIIGSMQGKAEAPVTRSEALNLLGKALVELADHAGERKVTLLYEHLNRYETNLLNRIEDVLPFVKSAGRNVKILADLFHMSIEEQDVAAALRAARSRIGHVHFADSNRRPAGLGHTDFAPIFAALRETNYHGYISAEALPYPDPESAAAQTIRAFRQLSGQPAV